jgi:hypothetical protein
VHCEEPGATLGEHDEDFEEVFAVFRGGRQMQIVVVDANRESVGV